MSSMSPSDSDAEREPFDTPVRPAPAQAARRGRWGTWGTLMGMGAVAVALVIGLLVRAGVATANQPAGSTVASARWQTYHDSYGLFTLQLPPAWTAQVDTSAMAVETITFDDPEQGKGSAKVIIAASSIDRQGVCRAPSLLHSFSGLTLNDMEHTGAYSIFQTENASFQIDVTIPGVLSPSKFGPTTSTPTPIPAAWVATDKTEVNEMLVSFHPTDPKPLKC